MPASENLHIACYRNDSARLMGLPRRHPVGTRWHVKAERFRGRRES
jgi:hypothetical protein